jgi:hypothetical protein
VVLVVIVEIVLRPGQTQIMALQLRYPKDPAPASVGSLAVASGLRFTYSGPTDDRPDVAEHANRGGNQTRLLIAWTAPGQRIILAGTDHSGITYPRPAATSDGPVIIGADILVNSRLTSAARGTTYLREVLLHELGHAVGLRHVALTGQIMSAAPGPFPLSDYQSGDRLGLRTLGSGGCLRLPASGGWRGILAR